MSYHGKVTSWSGAESAHPIIGDVRIKYVSVYPDGKVTLWSEGGGDPGAIGSIVPSVHKLKNLLTKQTW